MCISKDICQVGTREDEWFQEMAKMELRIYDDVRFSNMLNDNKSE